MVTVSCQAISFFRQTIDALPRVSAHFTWCLNRLKIKTVRDLLWHLPVGVRNYPLASLKDAQNLTKSTLCLKITAVQHSKILRVYAEEETPSPFALQILFFRGNFRSLKKVFVPGSQWFFSGDLGVFDGYLSMVHPVRWCAQSKGPPLLTEVVYPLTTGLKTSMLQGLVMRVLKNLPEMPEWLPEEVCEKQNWPSFSQALWMLHQVTVEKDLDPLSPARQRLAFDEILAYQLTLLAARNRRQHQKAQPLIRKESQRDTCVQNLGFSLTRNQEQVVEEIGKDLAGDRPMARLLQGDVGSGKTVVAFVALLQALENGAQGAFLVPTEVLAKQQVCKLKAFLEGTGKRFALLTRQSAHKKSLLEEVAQGGIDVVVGTHALLETGVVFKNLGLVVIDEQHRFGVEQRLRLTQKGQSPHLLVMSATPIPRTLEMTLFGDLDVSVLTEKPGQRPAIETRVLPQDRLSELYGFISNQLVKGAQIYWVCPLIEESESSPQQPTVQERFSDLSQRFPDQVGMLHGKQSAAEKENILTAFRTGSLRLLVATTVIEVGVDVPQATLMVIEGAQRFGLAQLHQLRGRVGRGDVQSYCFLVYQKPLSESVKHRLDVLRKSTDGFWIAEQDWKVRGGGDVLGIRQSGLPFFYFADLQVHFSWLSVAQHMARELLQAGDSLPLSQRASLRLLIQMFQRSLYGVS